LALTSIPKVASHTSVVDVSRVDDGKRVARVEVDSFLQLTIRGIGASHPTNGAV
jgi:hypothetical protein